MEFGHKPVMLDECMEGLAVKPDGIYVDCTLGGGGHSLEIAKRLTDGGRLIAIDKDADALKFASERLKDYKDKITFVKSDFKNAAKVLDDLNIDKVDGVLMDLGVSSWQIDNFDRGFSYRSRDSRLDMRMDAEQSLSAYEVVNDYGEEQLYKIIRDYGEENFAKKIAFNICKYRQVKPIETTGELIDVIERSMPPKSRFASGHPAKRTFQAIRIEVNAELDGLDGFLEEITDRLKVGGRIAVITFHSLEDRIVKQKFKWLEKDCICPPKTPICICGKVAKLKLITNKPIVAGETEKKENSRSQSAKLRVAEKI
jgi:16S rRNA (cytosine1402-N4)-methyltransferase